MQPLTIAPREHLTEDEVRDLLTRGDVTVSAGLELLDNRNRFVADISASLGKGGKVTHSGRDVVHGACTLPLLQALAWGRDRLRPYMILSDRPLSQEPTIQARFNLGVYVLTTPQTKLGEEPPTYDVQGYDLLQPLLDPVGDTYVVIPADGEEAIPTTGFETGLGAWESNAAFGLMHPATFIQSTLHPSAGTKSMEITWPTTGAGGLSWVDINTSAFVVGKTYKFAADVWVPVGGPSQYRFDIIFVDNSPWFAVTPGTLNHIEWLWTATRPDAFVGLTTHDTTAGQKTYLDEFHAIAQSTTCLDAVRTVLDSAGVGAPLLVDGTQQVAVLDGPMVWGLTEGGATTWLDIINDLLAAVGYRELWVDQDGNYRTEPYKDPKNLPVQWTFDLSDPRTNIVGPDRTRDEDVWKAPNRWKFIRRGMPVAPIEGDGVYTVNNIDRGPTSQQSLGRVVRKTVYLDAVDQDSLVAQGDRIVVEDTAVARKVTLSVNPLPIAGHLDVVQYVDGALSMKGEVTSWEISLDGTDGQWSMEVMD